MINSMVVRLGANPPKHNWNIMWKMWQAMQPVPKVERKPQKKFKALKPKRIDSMGYTLDPYTPVLRHKIGVPQVPQKKRPAKDFSSFLEKKGFVSLGAGAFSTVYGKPGSNRVVKVCRNPDDWIEYCYWGAQQGQAGKLAPKVYSYKVMENGTYVAVMERMEYEARKHDPSKPLHMFTTLIPHVVGGGWHKPSVEAAHLINYLLPGSAEYLTELNKLANGHGLDLHDGNVMFRADGSICITDPVTTVGSNHNFKRLREKDFSPAIW